jgi:hypothetical protein
MIPITLDISDTINEFSLDKEESRLLSKSIVNKLAKEFDSLWEEEIKTLKSSRNAYKRAKYEVPPQIDDYSAVFTLSGAGETGTLAMMIENGVSSFDMKEGFRNSDKAENKGTENWYLTIPMQIATADAIADSPVFSGKMEEEIQKIVKRDSILTKKNVPKELQIKTKRSEVEVKGVKIPEYKSKSFKFEGLKRNIDPKHGGYFQFRRVSEKSDDNSWIHTGIDAYNLMGKAIKKLNESTISRIVGKTIQDFLKNII